MFCTPQDVAEQHKERSMPNKTQRLSVRAEGLIFELLSVIMNKSSCLKTVSYTHLNLTLEEAAAYSGIGINKLRQLTDDDNCEFVLWIGTKRLIKRRKFDEYIEKLYSL